MRVHYCEYDSYELISVTDFILMNTTDDDPLPIRFSINLISEFDENNTTDALPYIAAITKQFCLPSADGDDVSAKILLNCG